LVRVFVPPPAVSDDGLLAVAASVVASVMAFPAGSRPVDASETFATRRLLLTVDGEPPPPGLGSSVFGADLFCLAVDAGPAPSFGFDLLLGTDDDDDDDDVNVLRRHCGI